MRGVGTEYENVMMHIECRKRMHLKKQGKMICVAVGALLNSWGFGEN